MKKFTSRETKKFSIKKSNYLKQSSKWNIAFNGERRKSEDAVICSEKERYSENVILNVKSHLNQTWLCFECLLNVKLASFWACFTKFWPTNKFVKLLSVQILWKTFFFFSSLFHIFINLDSKCLFLSFQHFFQKTLTHFE